MSNVVLFEKEAARPSYAMAKQEASALTKSLSGGGGYPGKKLSIKGGVFRLIDNGKEISALEERYLDVVIVRAAEHISRSYYDKSFDDTKLVPPACWSVDGVAPDATVPTPQSNSCATCPQNVKGSGNDESRACRFSQRVALLLANDLEGSVLQLILPATSLFGKEEGADNRPLQAYARFLNGNSANIEQFITRLKFDTKVATPKLFFKPMRWLEESEYAIAQAQGASDEAVKAVEFTVAQIVGAPGDLGVPGKPLAVVKPAPAAAKPAPVVEPEEDEEGPPPPPPSAKKAKAAAPVAAEEEAEAPAPEPKKRKAAAPAAEVAPRKSIADIASRWDVDDE